MGSDSGSYLVKILTMYKHIESTGLIAPIVGKRVRKSFAIPLCKLCVCHACSHLSYMKNWWNGKMLNEWIGIRILQYYYLPSPNGKKRKRINVNDVQESTFGLCLPWLSENMSVIVRILAQQPAYTYDDEFESAILSFLSTHSHVHTHSLFRIGETVLDSLFSLNESSYFFNGEELEWISMSIIISKPHEYCVLNLWKKEKYSQYCQYISIDIYYIEY